MTEQQRSEPKLTAMTADEIDRAVRQIIPAEAELMALQVTMCGPFLIEVKGIQLDGYALVGIVKRSDLR